MKKIIASIRFIRSFCILICVFFNAPSFAVDNSEGLVDARIRGVAQFLLDRAQDNFLYILGQNIVKHEKFKDHFPNTHYFIKVGDLKLLLKSNRKIWSDIVERDLRQMIEKYVILKVGVNTTVTKLQENLKGAILEQHIGVKLEKYKKTLDNNHNLNPKIKHEMRRKLTQYEFMLDKLNRRISDLHKININECKIVNEADSSNKSSSDWSTFTQKCWMEYLNTLSDIGDLGKKLFSGLRSEIENASFSEADLIYDHGLWEYVKERNNISWWTLELIRESHNGDIEKLINIKKEIVRLASSDLPLNLIFLKFEKLSRVSNKSNSTVTSEKILGMDENSRKYKRFRKYVLFFTQLTDAETPDQVESLLLEMTVPPASFGIKREAGEHHLMFSGYLGFLGGTTYSTKGETDFDSEGGYFGITAPLGFEWSYGCHPSKDKGINWCSESESSFNIMISPIDLFHPINVILTDNDDNVKLDDIIAPGLFISRGVKGYPVTYGFGIQQGKAIRADTELENRYFLFVAFEIPMFVLH